ncbi:GNAT family protein [Phytomonospora sp. NPDC050363]|uniref:GNAT family N-acetyltransferase n=1 Tax=Phytomonospora sp. NPDC050363 TaxID=3155642 RepID=UPI003409FEC9
MTDWFDRPVLAGKHVRLEPLTLDHTDGLFAAGADPGIWTWLRHTQPSTVEEMRAVVAGLLDRHAAGTIVPWAQIDAVTGEVAGTTQFHDLAPREGGLFIGGTWIGAKWHRTGLNTEAKLLLLDHAFDTLGAQRVGWQTDDRNERSQRAIERLGAVKEGVLRRHRLRPDGSHRDTVTYSIIREEWPAARERLTARLRD